MTISALPMLARAWAQPNVDYSSDIPEELQGVGAKVASGLENPWYAITVHWTWPSEFFSKFQIVRTVRSPAVRREEGQVLITGTKETWSHYNEELTENPIFTDPQPPPNEWVYYTIFCLDENRVWKNAGSAYEIGPQDYEWTLRLPELLPGASITEAQSMGDPAEQSNELVEFLQSPASYLDMVTTKGESIQHFWDPLRCPPQLVPHIAASWGFGYQGVTGLGRSREILAATRAKTQGSLAAIGALSTGATGTFVHTFISNNLMLNVNDSSFESGDIYDTGWDPIYTTPNDEGTKLDVRDITDSLLPPNVQDGYYLYIPDARTIKCGSYTLRNKFGDVVLDGDGLPTRVFDAVREGIPISTWTEVRMGCYAKHDGLEVPEEPKPEVTNTIEMSLDIYDDQGLFIENLPVLDQRTLSWEWKRYYNGDGVYNDGGDPPQPTDSSVAIPTGSIQYQPSDALTNDGLWSSEGGDYEGPHTNITYQSGGDDGIEIVWNPSATGNNGKAAVTLSVSGLAVGAKYVVHMTVISDTDMAAWNSVVIGAATESGPTVTPIDDAPNTSDFVWEADATTAFFGIEVIEPSGGWALSGSHRIVSFYVERENSTRAYGVPVLTVGDACSIDLIVTDDR